MASEDHDNQVDGSDLDGVHEQVAARLVRHEARYTSGRKSLIDALVRAGRPITLPDIVTAAPDLPQSSIYRNLDVLEESGVIRRITAGNDHAHFELSELILGHHHHLICDSCGTIVDIELDADLERLVDESLTAAAAKAGFTPLHHTLDLHGLCENCTP